MNETVLLHRFRLKEVFQYDADSGKDLDLYFGIDLIGFEYHSSSASGYVAPLSFPCTCHYVLVTVLESLIMSEYVHHTHGPASEAVQVY